MRFYRALRPTVPCILSPNGGRLHIAGFSCPSVLVRPVADVAASVRAPRRARGPRHRICRPWVRSSTLLPRSLPGAINALHVPQMRRTGLRQASLRHMAAGGTRFKSSSRGLPPRSPDYTPVCAISMSSISSSGLPEAPLESRSWPAPVSRHRNFRRSATGGTSPDHSSGRRHARHRLDEGVRQSRPGHPGVGRFGSCFPRRSPEDRTAAAAFPRRPVWDTVGGPSAAPHRISRILSGPT